MMQVWLVLIAIFLWQASRDLTKDPRHLLWVLAFGCVVISVILVFVNGGTVG